MRHVIPAENRCCRRFGAHGQHRLFAWVLAASESAHLKCPRHPDCRAQCCHAFFRLNADPLSNARRGDIWRIAAVVKRAEDEREIVDRVMLHRDQACRRRDADSRGKLANVLASEQTWHHASGHHKNLQVSDAGRRHDPVYCGHFCNTGSPRKRSAPGAPINRARLEAEDHVRVFNAMTRCQRLHVGAFLRHASASQAVGGCHLQCSYASACCDAVAFGNCGKVFTGECRLPGGAIERRGIYFQSFQVKRIRKAIAFDHIARCFASQHSRLCVVEIENVPDRVVLLLSV